MVICLERGANHMHMVQLMPLPPHHLFIKIQIGLTCLVPADPSCPGKDAIEWVFVFVTNLLLSYLMKKLSKSASL